MPTLTTLVDGTVPVAADFNGNYQALNNAIGSLTAISAWATGEIPYASAANTLSRLSPGTAGQTLTIASGLPAWAGGAWTTPSFSAGDFTAGGSLTWTVESGDVSVHKRLIIGKTMTVAFMILTTTTGGTANPELRISLGSAMAASTANNTMWYSDAGGANAVGMVRAAVGNQFLSLYKDPSTTTNWSNAASNNTFVIGEITFEIS